MNLKDIEEKEIIPGYKAKFIHSENMTQAHWNIEKDAILPEHSHPHEQVTFIKEGEFEITVDGKTTVAKKDDFLIIPPNAKHSGKALTDCRILDTFYPCREEYK